VNLVARGLQGCGQMARSGMLLSHMTARNHAAFAGLSRHPERFETRHSPQNSQIPNSVMNGLVSHKPLPSSFSA